MKAIAALALALCSVPAAAQDYRDRPPEDEVVYFVLPDRFENADPRNDTGGIRGDRLVHGFDPTHKGFFHGGDLKGLAKRLDYIQQLGATAIWLGPIYKNNPVQGPKGQESAGYHGYWITDFTDVDPHFGTRADLKELIDAAHARGMKVYLDIITNHSADIIQYRECQNARCDYRSLADYPYSTRGGPAGKRINEGFAGDDQRTAENFARLTDPSFAYTPFVPKGREKAKTPAWLNDPIYYHNRGDMGVPGESFLYGDFSGLDGIFTEHPHVVEGMIEIYGGWIDDFGIDGFRIDTARHVNPEFWQAFVPAMLARAKAKGIPNFHIFGEVFDSDPGVLARHTRVDKLPTNLDFAFAYTAIDAIAKGNPTAALAKIYSLDPLYEGGTATARRLPTFLGNHDMGRFAGWVRNANPEASDEEVLKRVTLGHALMFFGRGVPVIYYGDEQGFMGDGGDQDAREDMFPSKVATYNDNKLVGTNATNAESNFDTAHPLYASIRQMAAVRAADPALRRGELIARAYGEGPGLFAFSRRLGETGETLVLLNTSEEPVDANVAVDYRSTAWTSVSGQCAPAATAPGSYRVRLEPLSYMVCRAQ